MNAKINNLIKQSYVTVQTPSGEETTYFSQEKFAELIVRECAKACEKNSWMALNGFQRSKQIKEHFGVEE